MSSLPSWTVKCLPLGRTSEPGRRWAVIRTRQRRIKRPRMCIGHAPQAGGGPQKLSLQQCKRRNLTRGKGGRHSPVASSEQTCRIELRLPCLQDRIVRIPRHHRRLGKEEQLTHLELRLRRQGGLVAVHRLERTSISCHPGDISTLATSRKLRGSLPS